MGQSRRERTWPEPASTRHAWFRDGNHPHDVPRQVFVTHWTRRDGQPWALIVDVIPVQDRHEPAIVHRWVPGDHLTPVPARLNKVYGLR